MPAPVVVGLLLCVVHRHSFSCRIEVCGL